MPAVDGTVPDRSLDWEAGLNAPDNLTWEDLEDAADSDASSQADTDDDDIPELDSVAVSGYQVSSCLLYTTMAVVCVLLFTSVCSTCPCAFIRSCLLLFLFIFVAMPASIWHIWAASKEF